MNVNPNLGSVTQRATPDSMIVIVSVWFIA